MGLGAQTVDVLEAMVKVWPGFAGLAPTTGVDGSIWKKISIEDSDGTTPQLPIAIDLIHYADALPRDAQMLGDEAIKGVRILVKIYVFDDRKTPQTSRTAKGLLEDLTDELYRMVMQSAASFPFGAAHNTAWYQDTPPDHDQPYAKYSRRDKERFSTSLYTFLAEQANPIIPYLGFGDD